MPRLPASRPEGTLAALHVLTRGLAWPDGATGGGVAPPSPDELARALTIWLVRVVALEVAARRGLVEIDLRAVRDAIDDAAGAGGSAAGSAVAWSRIDAASRSLHAHRGGALFDPAETAALDAIAPRDATIATVLAHLDDAGTDDDDTSIEAVGAAYEALLGMTIDVAPEPRVVLRGRRPTGGAPADPAIGLATLLAMDRSRRVEHLAALGVDLPARAARAVAAAETVEHLVDALRARVSPLCPGVVAPGWPVPHPTEARRRAGAHYTPRALADAAVDRALGPLLAAPGVASTADAILALRIADPAMGCGAFLLATLRRLGDALDAALREQTPGSGSSAAPATAHHARVLVAAHVLHGVDRDPLAVEVARASVWLACGSADAPLDLVDHALRAGDALAGETGPPAEADPRALARAAELRRLAREAMASGDAAAARAALREAELATAPLRAAASAAIAAHLGEDVAPFHWALELPDVVPPHGRGFDAILGNPPWVSYAGRAAQPLDPRRRAFLEQRFAAFHGFRNLQGAFVERSAELLRPGGRLGLVLPSSMSEQSGYAPARAAHDRLATCDGDLLDVGEDAFAGVFQPCLVLTSTRRAVVVAGSDAPWPVERPELDRGALRLMDRLSALPRLPPSLFGERGLQSSGDDLAHLAPSPRATDDVPLRAGADIRPFWRGSASYHADRAWFGARLRTPEAWSAVRLLIRQTAAYPIVTRSDGIAFRNSILAGFETDDHPAALLVAWLNATPVRWLHFVRHRDARQGMPQVKIGHLRATPAPPPGPWVAELARLGDALATRNAGVDPGAQTAIDDLVARALDLDDADRARIAAWWRAQ